MSNKIKDILYIAIILALLAGVYAAFSFANSYSRSIQPGSFRSFSVSGEGKITAIPDVAQFSFSVITQGGKDIAKIQKENTDKVNAVIDFLKSQKIDDKDIKTQNYSLDPQYQYFECRLVFDASGSAKPCPPPVIAGYTINQTVSVKIRNFDIIGDMLGGVVQKGANSVSQLSFTIDDPESLKNQARAEAIEKAQEKAKSMAKAGGFRIGELLSIEESGFSPQPLFGFATAMKGAGDLSAESFTAPAIEPGSQEIIVNVVLRYEIK